MLTKRSIIQKTIQVGGSTMMSRLLGLVREVLMANYLGAGVLAEAFITAFKIPNSLRKIFAEGALSVSFIPTFVKIVNTDGKTSVNRLMTLALILFEGILFVICLLIIWKTEWVIRIIVPGWFAHGNYANIQTHGWAGKLIETMRSFWLMLTGTAQPLEQVAHAVKYLRVLMGFILLLSTSALLAGALQAVNHFFIPAFAPVLLNVVYIAGIVTCITFKLSPLVLCIFIMGGGLVQLGLHIIMYIALGFSLAMPDAKTWLYFKEVWHKFLPCLFSMSVMEIYLFIDTSLGSFLPTGSIALIYYATRFMQIPLGVFATAFSTILLPHFSRIGVYAPRRLGFYLFESAKLIVWVMIPVSLFMGFSAYKIFLTLFLSKKFTLIHVAQAATILGALLYGIVFFSLNKILLNLYYALHDTTIPMYISVAATIANFVLSYWLMQYWGAYGIACATSLAGMLQTFLFLLFLHLRYRFAFYIKPFFVFFYHYALQLFIFSIAFLVLHAGIIYILSSLFTAPFFINKIGYWLWALPLAGINFWFLVKTRKFFGIRLYFLD